MSLHCEIYIVMFRRNNRMTFRVFKFLLLYCKPSSGEISGISQNPLRILLRVFYELSFLNRFGQLSNFKHESIISYYNLPHVTRDVACMTCNVIYNISPFPS